MTRSRTEEALLEALFREDALYDDDVALAARELPPAPWRASDGAVAAILEMARRHLEEAWRRVREHDRRARMIAAFEEVLELPVPATSRRRLLARLAALESRAGVTALGERATDTISDDDLRRWIGELEDKLGLARGSSEQAAVTPRRPSVPGLASGVGK